MKYQRLGLALAVATAAALAPTAPQAVEVQAGAWKFTLDGNVNADYIHSTCQSNPVTIGGGLACTSVNGDSTASSVSNGLLPAAFVFGVSTTQNGLDIAANLGLYPGTSTNDGGSPNLQDAGGAGSHNTALGSASLDVRQVYMTFGNASMGTFTVGRNIGLFQQDAILNDMTLPGVGGPGGAASGSPANTTLGGIGLGYIYTDWLSQIDYTTPDLAGTKITFGIFDPLNPVGEPAERKSAPGFHAKIAYTMGGLYLSASGLYQKQTEVPGATLATSVAEYDSHGFDIGGKYKIGGLEVMGWYYNASGIGTTALFLNGADAVGNSRDSNGFIAQVTYTVGPTKFGINYGQSRLDPSDEERATAGDLVYNNRKWTGGIYHKLTDNLTILGEYSRVSSIAQNGSENSANTFNIGAFMSF